MKPSFLGLPPLPTFPPEFWASRTSSAKAKATTTTTTTTTPNVGRVTVELCEMIGSSSCYVCATSTVFEFTELLYNTYESGHGEEQGRKKYSQRVMNCLASSQSVQVVKLAFNTNIIRPTEITIFGNGTQFFSNFLR